VGLEQGPLSLVSTIEELLGRNSSSSNLETENTAMGICCADPISTKVCTISSTSGGLSVSIVHSRTKAMGFVVLFVTMRKI
jgi:hypothetical protein